MLKPLTRVTIGAILGSAVAGCGTLDLLSLGGAKELDTTRAPAGATTYQCDAGKRFYLRLIDAGAAAWVILPEREFRLARTPGTGPARYSNGAAVLELGDQTATLRDGTNVVYAECKPGSS